MATNSSWRSFLLFALLLVGVSSVYYLTFPAGHRSNEGHETYTNRPWDDVGGDDTTGGDDDGGDDNSNGDGGDGAVAQENRKEFGPEGLEVDKKAKCRSGYRRHDIKTDQSGLLLHCSRPRVKVLTSCYPPAGHKDMSIKNKMLYAKMQQYDFEWWVWNYEAPKGKVWRGGIWTKAVLLLDALDALGNSTAKEGEGEPFKCDYDWLLWMDCDSLVARFDFTIEHIVGEHLNDMNKHIIITRGKPLSLNLDTLTLPYYVPCLFIIIVKLAHLAAAAHFITTSDLNGINSGVMALRCTEWNRALWRRVWNAEQYISDPWAEQRALVEFHKVEPELRARVGEVPPEQLQYLLMAPLKRVDAKGQMDFFTIHFAGFWDSKDEKMAEFYPKVMLNAGWLNPLKQ